MATIRSAFEDPHEVVGLWIFGLKDQGVTGNSRILSIQNLCLEGTYTLKDSTDKDKGRIGCKARGEVIMRRVCEDEWDA